MPDVLERRILGAFRMVSAITTNALDGDFTVDGGALDVMRNRSGVYVVRDAPGMHDLTLKSDVRGVTIPAQQQFELTVADRARAYLPRRFKLTLPRNITPASDADSVMNAFRVQMYPTSAAPTGPLWAVLRVSVVLPGDPPQGVCPWSLVVVKQKSDGKILKTGMADERGEALVAVDGLPLFTTNGGGGALISSGVDVDVFAFFDPDNRNRPKGYVPDPDDLIARQGTLKSNSQSLKIASGSTNKVPIAIAI